MITENTLDDLFEIKQDKKKLTSKEISILDDMSDEQIEELIAECDKRFNFYNNMQTALKLVLNSVYGAFGNQYFVCSNKDIANAITVMCRETIKLMDDVNEDYWYNQWHNDTEMHKHFGITEVEQIPQSWIHLSTGMDWDGKVTQADVEEGIYQRKYPVTPYIDTDSIFVCFDHAMRWSNFEGDEVEFCRYIATERLQGIFKKHLDKYASKYKVKNIQNFELENINESILFITKKKYIKHILWEDGRYYNRLENIAPKGVTLIQSGTPKFAREKLMYVIKNVIFDNPKHINIKDITKLVKGFRNEFEVAEIDDISQGSVVNDYWSPGKIRVDVKDPKTKIITGHEIIDAPGVIQHFPELIYAKGTYHSRKAAGLYNHLLSHETDLQNIYEFIEDGDRVRIYPCISELNDRFAFIVGEYPKEFAPPVNFEELFDITFLKPLNAYLQVLNMPEINKKLRITFSLFN